MRCVARIPVVSLLILTTLDLVRQAPAQEPRIGSKVERRGDEIVVCGQLYHTTAPVVLWTDPGGYDAYRLERRFVPLNQANTPPPERKAQGPCNRFSLRRKGLSGEEV